MALILQNNEEDYFLTQRRRSVTGINAWNDLRQAYTRFFEKYMKLHPRTVAMVKALIFIQENRPDIYNVDFLKKTKQQ